MPKSLAAQWRIFWKSEINATIAKYEKENAMWRCTINRKTSPLNSPYTEITDEWLRETPTKTNLKNALVADIDADGKSTTAFSEKIKKGRVLSGLDVANYILSKIRCTHLSLEKLVYYAYADYLCEHSERLFEDHIYAFRHGPVINSVYETFKRSGSQYVKPFEFGDDSDIRTGVKELPARSRILFAKEGTEKLLSIDRTIAKYGKYSAGALVDLTHRAGTPWSYVDSSVAYQEISDNLIMAYHHVESV